MEHLTKQQIVLLTLLVSFVTSIATGIFTVTLMQQAPAGVTQTLNRIVERTVEKIVPVETQKAQIIKQEITTLVKEDDMVIAAVEKNEKSLVRIFGRVTYDSPEMFLGMGVVTSANGVVVTDKKLYAENISYIGEFYQGKKYPLEVLRNVPAEEVIFMSVKLSEGEKPVFHEARFGDSDTVRTGQKVVSIEGEKRISAMTGIITSRILDDELSTSTPQKITSLETNIAKKSDIFGSPLLNLSAEVIGIYLGHGESDGKLYTPSNMIKIGVASTTPSSKTVN